MQRIIGLGFLFQAARCGGAEIQQQMPLWNRVAAGSGRVNLYNNLAARVSGKNLCPCPTQDQMSDIELIQPSNAAWDRFVCAQPRAHLLQLSAWGALKSQFEWDAQIVALGSGDAIVAGALVFAQAPSLAFGRDGLRANGRLCGRRESLPAPVGGDTPANRGPPSSNSSRAISPPKRHRILGKWDSSKVRRLSSRHAPSLSTLKAATRRSCGA